MHIHPNNSLLLASIGAGREEARELQAKRAAEVRRKLSSAARSVSDEELSHPVLRVTRQVDQGDVNEEDEFLGRLFSVEA